MVDAGSGCTGFVPAGKVVVHFEKSVFGDGFFNVVSMTGFGGCTTGIAVTIIVNDVGDRCQFRGDIDGVTRHDEGGGRGFVICKRSAVITGSFREGVSDLVSAPITTTATSFDAAVAAPSKHTTKPPRRSHHPLIATLECSFSDTGAPNFVGEVPPVF